MRHVNERVGKRIVNYVAATLCLGAAVVCFRGATLRGFEYDELWTLFHFAGADSVWQIFRELAVPNNHPLHSLFVRLVVNETDVAELWVRLPSLIAGICLLALVPIGAWLVSRDRNTTVLTAVWCALNAPLLHFAQAARGYTMQSALIVGFALLIYLARLSPRREWHALVGAVLVGMSAVLVLPTSVLYLAAIGICDLADRIFQWCRAAAVERRPFLVAFGPVLAAYGLLSAVAAGWLISVAPELFQARAAFGESIVSTGAWLQFAGGVVGLLWNWPLAILAVVGLLITPRRRLAASLAIILIFPLAAAVLTRAGPPRAYLPSIPFGVFAAALGATRLMELAVARWSLSHWRPAVLVLLMLAPMCWLPRMLRLWTPVDWLQVAPQLQGLPTDTYISYPVTAGYVVHHYYQPGIVSQTADRVPTGDAFTFAQVGERRRIEGMCPPQYHTEQIAVPSGIPCVTRRIGDVDIALYRARRIRGETAIHTHDHSLYFAAIGPVTKTEMLDIVDDLEGRDGRCRWLIPNGFLSGMWPTTANPQSRTTILLVTTNLELPASELLAITERWDGKLRLYQCGEAELSGRNPDL